MNERPSLPALSRRRFGQALGALGVAGLGAGPASVQASTGMAGSWNITANGHTGVLTLTQHASGELSGYVRFGAGPWEPMTGYYCPGEQRAVLLRGLYDDPIQAYVGEYQPAQWLPLFRMWQPAQWRGLFYALDERGGASPSQNTFSFLATPEGSRPGLVVPSLPPLPPAQPGEPCLAERYNFHNRPSEFGTGSPLTLNFEPRYNQCVSARVQGWLRIPGNPSADFMAGHYAAQHGTLVMRRRLYGGSYMPKQLYVGRQLGGELLVAGFRGMFYALDAYAGATPQRMSFDWQLSA